ncbi:FAD:protein FMN transferase [Elusimicrobiota bacterium]
MNTYVAFTLPHETDVKIIAGGFEIVEEWEELFEANRGLSVLDIRIEPVLDAAIQVSDITRGAYDPTLYPLIELWGIHDNRWHIPGSGEIQAALNNTGWQKIRKYSKGYVVPQGMGFDFGGVGKGWVVDQVVDYFISKGVEKGIVDAGGDLRVWGQKIWKVGIQNPYGNGLCAILAVKNNAVATSGDYENYFREDGVDYHHILDPSTGRPVIGEYSSVTVIADRCTIADGLATGMFVEGSDRINEFEELGIRCVLVSNDSKYHSDGLSVKWLSYDKN